MIATVHVIVGGAVGTAVGYATNSPLLGFAAGFASHLVCDAIPHLDHPPAPRKNDELVWTPSIWIFALLDSAIAGLIVLLFWLRFPPPHEPYFVLGAIGGYLPDFIDNVPFWKSYIRKLPGFKQFHAFHETVHHNWEKCYGEKRDGWPKWWFHGILTQIVAVVLSLWYITKP